MERTLQITNYNTKLQYSCFMTRPLCYHMCYYLKTSMLLCGQRRYAATQHQAISCYTARQSHLTVTVLSLPLPPIPCVPHYFKHDVICGQRRYAAHNTKYNCYTARSHLTVTVLVHYYTDLPVMPLPPYLPLNSNGAGTLLHLTCQSLPLPPIPCVPHYLQTSMLLCEQRRYSAPQYQGITCYTARQSHLTVTVLAHYYTCPTSHCHSLCYHVCLTICKHRCYHVGNTGPAAPQPRAIGPRVNCSTIRNSSSDILASPEYLCIVCYL
ncbi:hypothetical protein J6590_044343 [Homalodisca vitripennis]|nr:hypothetical protein J6590_044343 [Homalodisca vitripennis]